MKTFIAYSPRLHRSHEIKADYYVEGNNLAGIPTFTFYRNDKKISAVETEYFKVSHGPDGDVRMSRTN